MFLVSALFSRRRPRAPGLVLPSRLLGLGCWTCTCENLVLRLNGKGGPLLLVPYGLLNQSNPIVFVPLCDGFWFHFLVHTIARRLRVLCCDSRASSPVLNPLESIARSNFDFLSSRENPNPFDLPSNSRDSLIFRTRSLGDMFTG